MSGANEWQATGPLPSGATLLEASAGTGKTFSITGLYARLVVERGLPVQQILVVTFTRAATAELRERIRKRLREFAALLEAEGYADHADREILARLDQTPGAAVRLRVAAEDFDQAQIFTIHAFCQRVLERFAFETGTRFDAALLEDSAEILDEILDDFLSRERYSSARQARFLAETCKLGRKEAVKVAGAVLGAREAVLGPDVAPCTAEEALREWDAACHPFAAAWRAGGEAECRAFFAAAGPSLNQNSYKPEQIAKGLASLEAGLADGFDLAELAAGPSWVANLVPATILGRVGKGKSIPSIPPILDLWARLVERANELAPPLITGVRRHFAEHVRREMAARLLARNAMTFDDLLHLVSDRVADPVRGAALVAALRGAYKAALIDEFQDTDAVQWRIFGTVFGDPTGVGGHLFLIGDPKQAIYGFRGADIAVYERAKASTPAERCYTLSRNFRSDRPTVDAINALYSGVDEAFVPRVDRAETFEYVQVGAEHGPRYSPGAALEPGLCAPLSIRTFDGEALGKPGSVPAKGVAERLIPGIVAEDIHAVLSTNGARQDKAGTRAVSPRDVAVLVRTNKQAHAVRVALRQRAIPSVIAAAGSVFASEEAGWLERWLEAIEEPTREGPARALAVTPLFGWQARDLLPPEPTTGEAVELDDRTAAERADPRTQRWIAWMKGLQGWRTRFESRGFVVAWNLALQELHPSGADSPGADAWTRLLSLQEGERHVTNLRHLGELCHAAQLREHMGPGALLHWLREQRDKGSEAREAAEIRLETDADAVQIVTIHKAKGLQYPIVFVPYLWDGRRLSKADEGATRHRGDGASRAELHIDLGLDNSSARKKTLLQEAARLAHEENLRLLYVALTRAEHQTVLYWGLAGDAGKSGSDKSPLAHLLHGHTRHSDLPSRQARGEARVKAAMDAKSLGGIRPDLDELAGRSEGTIAVSAVARKPGLSRYDASEAGKATGTLETALYPHGGFDLAWRRMSYTGLAGHRTVEMIDSRSASADGPARQIELPISDEPVRVDLLADSGSAAEEDQEQASERPDTGETPPEPLTLRWPDGPEPAPDDPVSPMIGLPGGTDFGSWVHTVLERLDFETGQERKELGNGERLQGRAAIKLAQEQARRQGLKEQVREGKPLSEALCEALPLIVTTPLGGVLGDTSLSQVGVARRLDELSFDFAVGGGTGATPGHGVLTSRIHEALLLGTPPGLEADTWRRVVEASRFGTLRGFMTGSLDLVFHHDERYFVADYKTNRISGLPPEGGGRADSKPAHYDEPWLAVEMARHNYYLQYHLYLVALHRFLKTRLPTYRYDTHVGGAYYLFVRGMVGPAARRDGPRVRGVYHHRPDAAVIEALSACLDTTDPAPQRSVTPRPSKGGDR